MSNKFDSFVIALDEILDKEKKPYHLGRIRVPMLWPFKRGVAFKIFLDEKDYEELNIEIPTDSNLDPVRKKFNKDGTIDRIYIPLEKKSNEEIGEFYYGAVKDSEIVLDLWDGYLFFVYSSREGEEELQIVKNVPFTKRNGMDKQVEVIKNKALTNDRGWH